MDVGLDREQEAFARATRLLAADIASPWTAGRGPDSAAPPLGSDGVWRRVVEAGWLAIRLGEEAGGADGSCVDVCVLVEELGRQAFPAPILGTLLLLEQLRVRQAPAWMMAQIASGERRPAVVLEPSLEDFAHTGPSAGAVAFDSAGATEGWVVGDQLSGHALLDPVVGADLTRSTSRLSLATNEPLAELAPRGSEDEAAVQAFALTLASADLLGIMGAALDAAVEHAKLRKQFGVPIGSFQAVKHLAAEAYISVEATRSAVWYAGWAVDALAPSASLEAARVAKAYASARGIAVIETAIQIFGGIGMTWESPLHVWQRRAHMDRVLFGHEFTQYRRLAERS